MQRENIEVCSFVLDPFGVEAVWLSDREIIERKNHNINSRRCDYLATNAANGHDEQTRWDAPMA
jgi:hypothetical protein